MNSQGFFFLWFKDCVLQQSQGFFCRALSTKQEEAGPGFVENKWSRPSVKRGWDTSSSHHCKERRGSLQLCWRSQGVLLLNNKARLNASELLSLPKQWRDPLPTLPHNRLQIFSAFFDALVVTKQIIADFFQLSPGCRTQRWARIRSLQIKGPQWWQSFGAVTQNLTL